MQKFPYDAECIGYTDELNAVERPMNGGIVNLAAANSGATIECMDDDDEVEILHHKVEILEDDDDDAEILHDEVEILHDEVEILEDDDDEVEILDIADDEDKILNDWGFMK